ncbi:glycosyltransferase family A protein [Fructilactobacillus sanfranciscensis]|uniref:glycosyltransferase family A protein n=1 Tax=Fructilactobacillus sanfranciscensis TaxID=1625 RepID=UPI001CDA8538|nr:glycosyltransferase family 2 protein [Fructilactobacillus sanfranciscensis]
MVNDGSTDESLTIIKNYKNNSKYDVTVLNNEKNMGVSYSRNEALKKVYGEFLTFLDADDVMLKNHINVLVDLLKKYDNVRIAVSGGSKHLKFNFDNFKKVNLYDRNDGFCELIGGNAIQGFLWNKIFYVEDIKKYNIKFDDEIYMGEDLLFVCQLYSKLNSGLVYSPHITYYYRPNQNSALRKSQTIDVIKGKSKNWLKTYNIIIKDAKNSTNEFSNYAFKLLSIQYYVQINELIYRLCKENHDQDALKFKSYLFIFLRNYFFILLFSKFFSVKEKIRYTLFTLYSLIYVFRGKL